MPRTIHLPIAPATDATCGDGRGAFCPFARASHFGTQYSCVIWGPIQDDDGWLRRRPECREAEIVAVMA
jgi:hypothetical protein